MLGAAAHGLSVIARATPATPHHCSAEGLRASRALERHRLGARASTHTYTHIHTHTERCAHMPTLRRSSWRPHLHSSSRGGGARPLQDAIDDLQRQGHGALAVECLEVWAAVGRTHHDADRPEPLNSPCVADAPTLESLRGRRRGGRGEVPGDGEYGLGVRGRAREHCWRGRQSRGVGAGGADAAGLCVVQQGALAKIGRLHGRAVALRRFRCGAVCRWTHALRSAALPTQQTTQPLASIRLALKQDGTRVCRCADGGGSGEDGTPRHTRAAPRCPSGAMLR